MAYATKEAKAAHGRAYYHANLAKRRQQNSEGYYKTVAARPEALLLRSAKSRAKAKGLPFAITVADISIPLLCPVLGIPLVRAEGIAADQSPTIDQIIPGAGYTPDNVRVISYRANRLKCDATLEEMELILADFRKLKKD